MTQSQPPLANLITLGVHDIGREREFYQRLGWPIVVDTDDFVVFELRGALLALFPRDQLARDAHAQPAPPSAGIASSVIITVERPEEVDELAARADAAGARLTKRPTEPEFFEGRDAYFADPEGNYWEIAWARGTNPVTAAARRAAGQTSEVDH
jgi:predicted lactoylglutathione lyase